jgi:hypothetical protein
MPWYSESLPACWSIASGQHTSLGASVHCRRDCSFLKPVVAPGVLEDIVDDADCCHALIVVLVRIRLSISTPARIILIPVFIPNLSSALASAILPALGESLIQIGSNNALIQLGAANVLHAVERILMGVVLDEAEAARCLLEAVKAHDEALDFPAFAEELVYLLLGGVEGEIADIEGGSVFELVFRFRRGFAVHIIIAVAFASSLLSFELIDCKERAKSMILRTFAVAYELGLSRRSMVLRRGGMVFKYQQ